MAEGSQANKLSNASARGDLPEVWSLLENGADVNGFNRYGRTSLQVVKLGSPAVTEALLRAGANPDTRDSVLNLTVTHDAARDGHADTVRVLVDHGADVNVSDDHGNLPLHLAAREGHLEVVQLLMACTTNPDRGNLQGDTPHDLALIYHRMDTAQYIAEYMAS